MGSLARRPLHLARRGLRAQVGLEARIVAEADTGVFQVVAHRLVAAPGGDLDQGAQEHRHLDLVVGGAHLGLAGVGGQLQAFEREAKLLSRLHHTALPPVRDYFCTGDDQQFFVMKFIPGQDLSELLAERREKSEGPFPLGVVLDWADQLLDALAYLHTQDTPIIHRDIKPANLKLKPDGKIVLLDFGLAKGAAGEMSVVGSVLSGAGTPQYAPLEQIHREGTDARSDLYSLAVTLFHLLTGQPPPCAFARKIEVSDGKSDPLRPAHEINPQIPLAVSAVLQHAASLSLDARPATAAEMREALRRANQTELLPNPVGNPAEPTTIDPPPAPRPTPTTQRLIDAINEENVGAVRDLLDQGVEINALGDYGDSPLVAAVKKCSLTIVKMLLAKGANLEVKTNTGATALMESVSNRGKSGYSNTDRIIRTLLEAGANANAKDNDGRTALMRWPGGPAIKALLDKGAEINAKDNAGLTALMHAVRCNSYFEDVPLLLSRGADVNIKNNEGKTALILAAMGTYPSIIRGLLDKGADVNARDNNGRTALMEAAKSSGFSLEHTQDLLDKGADVNARDNNGRTALMEAVKHGYPPDITLALLDKGADVNAIDNKGWTVLMLAEERPDNEKVIEMLKQIDVHGLSDLLRKEMKEAKSEAKRKKLAKQFAGKRAKLKQIVSDHSISIEERFAAQLKLSALPRNSAPSRVRNRCDVTGRPRAYYRKLRLSRIALRELGNFGQVPGLVKSSW